MAIKADSNAGFYGTIGADVWAHIAGTGTRYAVRGLNDLIASAGEGDRAIQLTPGVAWGDGIESTWDTLVELPSAPAVASGSRWDTIVVRRTWTPDGTPEDPTETGRAEVLLIPGSATKAVAIDLEGAPGTVADQPLWLARFAVGSSVVQELVDLRVFTGAGGGLVARDEAALQYLNQPGTQVTIGRTTWISTPNMSGGVSWTTDQNPQRLTLFGAGAGLVGNYGSGPEGGWLIQAGTTAQRSNPSGSSVPGAARVTFPKPFPNGVLTVVAINGHEAATGPLDIDLVPSGYGNYRDSFVYTVSRNGVRQHNLQHRINWIAIGW